MASKKDSCIPGILKRTLEKSEFKAIQNEKQNKKACKWKSWQKQQG